MLKLLLLIAMTLVVFVDLKKVPRSAEERLKYAITNLTGQFLNKQVQMKPETTLAISSFPLIAMLADLAIYSKCFTRNELLSILMLNNVDEIRSFLPKYVARFNTQGNVKSELSFKAFTNISDSLTYSFIEDFKVLLRGKTQNINYNCPEEAASIINEWGKVHTSTSKGENVITKGEIPNDSGMVLVSTHDIQVNWDDPFNPHGMKDIDFKVNNNEVITMPALYGDGLLYYAVVDWLGCVVVEIPMKGRNHSVLLFLPDEVEGLPKLLNNIKEPDCFYKAMDMLKSHCITVYIPLGEVNAVVDLRKNLEQVISTSIFNSAAAAFCGISQGSNSIYVSSMLHQFHLIGNAGVNESSTTTRTPSNLCADSCDSPVVIFNRPFAFYVMEKQFNIPMIGGLYYKST